MRPYNAFVIGLDQSVRYALLWSSERPTVGDSYSYNGRGYYVERHVLRDPPRRGCSGTLNCWMLRKL